MFQPKKRLTLLEWAQIEKTALENKFLISVLELEEQYIEEQKLNKTIKPIKARVKKVINDFFVFWIKFFWFFYYYRVALMIIFYVNYVKNYLIKYRDRRWALRKGEEYFRPFVLKDNEDSTYEAIFQQIELNYFLSWMEVQFDLTLVWLEYFVTLEIFFDIYQALVRIKKNIKNAKMQYGYGWSFGIFFLALIREFTSFRHYVRIRMVFWYFFTLFVFFLQAIWFFLLGRILYKILNYIEDAFLMHILTKKIRPSRFFFFAYMRAFLFFDIKRIKYFFWIRMRILFARFLCYIHIKSRFYFIRYFNLKVLKKRRVDSILVGEYDRKYVSEVLLWWSRYLFKIYLVFITLICDLFVLLGYFFYFFYSIFLLVKVFFKYIKTKIKDKWLLR